VKLSFDYNGNIIEIELTSSGKSYRARVGERHVDFEILQAKEGKLDLLVDGKRVTAYVSSDHATRWVTANGQTLVLTRPSGVRKGSRGHQHAAGELTAPMPGQVRAVNVSERENVTKGQTLLVLEAMKMEIRVQAPKDGVVRKLFVQPGQTVEREQILIEIDEG
jgi:biotin carboxyl carrier protein